MNATQLRRGSRTRANNVRLQDLGDLPERADKRRHVEKRNNNRKRQRREGDEDKLEGSMELSLEELNASYETNPAAALKKFCYSTGNAYSFVERINAETCRPLSREQMDACVEGYNLEMDWLKLHIFCCGVCGRKELQSSKFSEMPLSELSTLTLGEGRPFIASDEYIHYIEGRSDWKSVFTILRDILGCFLLQPDGVRHDAKAVSVQVCGDCNRSLKALHLPKYCIASGYDWGRVHSVLPSLSLAERKLIALNIPYIHVLKLNFGQPALKGQVIAFPHEGRHVVTTKVLPRSDIEAWLVVAVVGGKKPSMEQVRNKFSEVLRVRVDTVYQWLRFLIACNPLYRDVVLKGEKEEAVVRLHECEERLISSAVNAGGEDEQELEAIVTNNIAQQQSEESTQSLLVQDQPSVESDLTLAGVANGMGLSEECVFVRQSTRPVNKFCENDRFWLGSFPDLFPFGKGVPSKGRLPEDLVKHLLLQADMRFAQCDEFVFAAFNQMQRHSLLQSSSFRVRTGHPTTLKLVELINSENFLDDLKRACAEPQGQIASKLRSQLGASIRLVGSQVPWSGYQRQKLLGTMKGYLVAFGMPSFFVTWAPCDIDSPLLLRLSGVVEREIPLLSVSERMRILGTNSVCAARAFIHLTKAIFEHLVCLPPSHCYRKSVDSAPKKEGIFGVCKGYTCCIESQGRGSLHLHGLFWTDLQPELLQGALTSNEAIDALCRRLDSIIQCSLPPRGTTASEEGMAIASTLCPSPMKHPEEFEKRWIAVARRLNVHQHAPTCHKGKAGQLRCRMGYPQAIVAHPTRPCQLILVQNEDGKRVVRACETIQARQTTEQRGANALAQKDPRILVLEHHRPLLGVEENEGMRRVESSDERATDETRGSNPENHSSQVSVGLNSWVVNFNRFLTGALGCNTAVYYLGIMEQAKGAMYYMADYLVKSPSDLAALLSLAVDAQKKITQFPSTAEDSGTPERSAQHFLARLLNNITGMQEIPAQMAAAALLGCPGEIVSHMTEFVWIHPAVGFLLQQNCIEEEHEEGERDSGEDESEGEEEENEEKEEDEEAGNKEPTPLEAERDSPEPEMEAHFMQDDESIFDEEEGVADAGVSVSLIKVQGKRVPLSPQHENYFFRGRKLEAHSLYFYVATVKVIPFKRKGTGEGQEKEKGKEKEKEKEKEKGKGKRKGKEKRKEKERSVGNGRNENGAGRKRNGTFFFDERHPLSSVLVQQLRSKQVVPVFAGSKLPAHPGERKEGEEWAQYMKRADRFALYLLTLFKPWGPDECNNVTWQDLDAWVAFLQRAEATFEEKCTLQLMCNFSNNLTTSSYTRWITSNWRNRTATRWNEAEIAEARRNEAPVDEDQQVAMQAYLEYLQATAEEGSSEDSLQEVYNRSLIEELNSIFADRTGQHTFCETSTPSVLHYDDTERVALVSEMLRNPMAEQVQGTPELTTGGRDVAWQGLQALHSDERLNPEQNRALLEVLTWLSRQSTSLQESGTTPLHILIHGGPGTGKSFFASTLMERAKEIPKCGRILCCAPTGIASTLLPGGQTVHSLLRLPIDKRGKGCLSAAKAQAAKNRLASVRLLILDEVSMVDASLLERMDTALRQLLGNQAAFGGLGMILMGDFFQLPCIGRPLYSASLSSKAGQLFKEFNVFSFVQQMRAASDEVHSTMLELLRSPSTSGMTEEMFGQLQVLNRRVLEDDPSWRFAPIVVTNNRERHALNIYQMKAFAKSRGYPVVCWKKVLHSQAALWFSRQEARDRLFVMNSELWGWFVPGAPIFLTENINPEKGLANGTQATMASLTLAGTTSDRFWEDYRSCRPGKVLELEHPPLAVNVQVKRWEKATAEETLYSENGDTVVVPLKVCGWNECKMKQQKGVKVVKGRKRGAIKFQDYPYELGFALTYHKVQGQTMRVILDLNRAPANGLDRAMLLVGLSRARTGKDVMVLPMITSAEHLLSLKWDKRLIEWWQRVPVNRRRD